MRTRIRPLGSTVVARILGPCPLQAQRKMQRCSVTRCLSCGARCMRAPVRWWMSTTWGLGVESSPCQFPTMMRIRLTWPRVCSWSSEARNAARYCLPMPGGSSWRAACWLVMLAAGCAQGSNLEIVQVSEAAAVQFLHTPSLYSALRSDAPRSVLFVDATCPNSLVALEAALAAPSGTSTTAFVHRPQTKRDRAARIEGAALECAHRQGVLQRYVRVRLDHLADPNRPLTRTAAASGADTTAFLECLKRPDVVDVVARHEAASDNAGVTVVPALLSADHIVVGRDPVVEVLRRGSRALRDSIVP